MKELILMILIIFMFSSCGIKIWEQDKFANSVCECYEKFDSGNIDQKLKPCFTNPINKNFEEIHESIYPDLNIKEALEKYSMDIMIELIRNCDDFYFDMNTKYTNFYPKISFESIHTTLSEINDSIRLNSLSDSVKIKLLHKRISINNRLRIFDKSFADIDILSKKFKLERETYLASAYIYMFQKQYEKALEKIDLAIKYNNPNYILYKELIIRRMKVNGLTPENQKKSR